MIACCESTELTKVLEEERLSYIPGLRNSALGNPRKDLNKILRRRLACGTRGNLTEQLYTMGAKSLEIPFMISWRAVIRGSTKEHLYNLDENSGNCLCSKLACGSLREIKIARLGQYWRRSQNTP